MSNIKVILREMQYIYGLDADQRNNIKEHLTFDNPAYASARKFGRSKYISIPMYLTYYSEFSYSDRGVRKKGMKVPVGVDLKNVLNTSNIDYEEQRVFHKTGEVVFPKFSLTLREDQKLAEKAYMSQVFFTYSFSDTIKGVIQLPTGKGKSILALHIASLLEEPTLILVHKDDLVAGWKKDIALCFPDMEVGLIKAKSRKVGKYITIATVQTLSRMSDEELSKYTDKFGLVVQDECHHIGLNIFNVINKFNSRYKIGLSATPTRSDGLNFVFDIFLGGLCYKHEVTADDEDISQVKVSYLRSPFKYRPFVYEGQVFNYYDFEPEELPDEYTFVDSMPYDSRPKIPYLTIDNEVVTSDETGLLVCSKIIQEYRKGRSILALFTQKEHIRAYYEYLKEHIPEDEIMLYYGDNNTKSEVLMKKAEDREVLVTLATYAKATEGTNVKSWEVLFLVSSLNNEKNVEQAVGRIRRKKEGKIDPVLVYDVVYDKCYSLQNHVVTRERVYKRLKFILPKFKVSKPARKVFTRGYLT